MFITNLPVTQAATDGEQTFWEFARPRSSPHVSSNCIMSAAPEEPLPPATVRVLMLAVTATAKDESVQLKSNGIDAARPPLIRRLAEVVVRGERPWPGTSCCWCGGSRDDVTRRVLHAVRRPFCISRFGTLWYELKWNEVVCTYILWSRLV